MKPTLLDAASYWVGEKLLQFGVKRALVATLIGLCAVAGVIGAVGLFGLVKAVVAISSR